MKTTKTVNERRNIEASELLDLVATVSRMADQNAADFINEAVQTATAKALGYQPREYALIELTPTERFEVTRLVAQRNGQRVADFIKAAVIAETAWNISIDEKVLKEILGRSEPWTTIYC